MDSSGKYLDTSSLLSKKLSQNGVKNSNFLYVSAARDGVVRPCSPTEEHQEMLRTCRYITELKADEVLPDWIIEKSKVHNHTGEFPLFKQKMLSTRKDEQLSGRPSLQSPKLSKAERGQLFNRLEQSHKYLMATMSESSINDLAIDQKPQITTYTIQFGRPTRSSLLRSAHQSASLSRTIPGELELHKRSLGQGTGRASSHSSGLQAMSLGETVHSFLVGARYNRNCLDSQAFKKYGLFISRCQPRVTFLTHCSAEHQRKPYESQGDDMKGIKIGHRQFAVN
ncbi:uncharacterized protein LOC134585589 [Pelobates fuscus]|uniref:uncharacterized protein LOC134585589 n=1 Tax=Pelobates fuscus TaxID=191477 RepID=UPI002FE48AE0